MNLVLRGLTLNENPLSQPMVGRFDERGGSIGRSDNATLTLPDPERLISRVQANVTFSDGAYWLVDVGSANPVVHNGLALGAGVKVRLGAHDDLRIGGYRLTVEYEHGDSGATILRGRTTSQPRPLGDAAVAGNAMGAANPFSDLMAPNEQPRGGPPAAPLGVRGSAGGATDPFADLRAPAAAAPAGRAASPASSKDPFADLLAPAPAGAAPAGRAAPPASSKDPFADLLAPAPAAGGASAGRAPPSPSSKDPFADLLAPGPAAGAPAAYAMQPSSSADPFADLLGPAPAGAAPAPYAMSPAPSKDPFADLLAPAPAAPPPSAAAPAAREDPFAGLMGAPAAPAARLPDDFDPFAEPTSAPAPARAQSADPLAMISSAAPSLDEAFGLNRPGARSGGELLGDFLGTESNAARGDAVSLDPLVALGATPAPARLGDAPVAANHVPELAGAYRPPQVRMPAPPAARPAPATPMPQPAGVTPASTPASAPVAPLASNAASNPASNPASNLASNQATPAAPSTYTANDVWRGFIEGVGVDLPLPRGVTPEMMRTVGVMLRYAIDGVLQLMAVRAAAKSELRAAVTVIQVRDNNPLKFSPNVDAALSQLLQPPGRGFLGGPSAVREAVNDLQSHQIGVMAGMRAALAGVLARFEPSLLEDRLTKLSVLDALLPMNRKAKLWELFLQNYNAIRNEAEEDFHQLFGKAFIAAYEAQVERLERAQKPPANSPQRQF